MDCRIDILPEALEILNRQLIKVEIIKRIAGGSPGVIYSKTQGEAVESAVRLSAKLIEECNNGGLSPDKVFAILKEQFPELLSNTGGMSEEEKMTPEAP